METVLEEVDKMFVEPDDDLFDECPAKVYCQMQKKSQFYYKRIESSWEFFFYC